MSRDPICALEKRFRPLWRHPVLTLAAVCVALMAMTDQSSKWIFSTEGILVAGVLCLIAWLMLTWEEKRKPAKRAWSAALGVVMAVAVMAGLYGLRISQYAAVYFGVALLGVLGGVALYLTLTKQMTWRRAVILLVLAGFAVRLSYVLYTNLYTRQHDIGIMGEDPGHIGYVEYLLENRHLLTDNPMYRWQFYHPPLHHTILAIVMGAVRKLGMGEWRSWECMQFVTLFYSGCIMLTSYRILREMRLEGKGMVAAMSLAIFCPVFIQFSGALNNDQLSVLFMLCALLQAIRWYKDPKWKHILLTALCIGLGMMTKLSAGMVAPAVAWLFIARFIRSTPQQRKRLLGQFGAFAVVCVPLGLWWAVRNNLLYQMPLTYVPDIGKDSGQYVGNIPAWRRLFDFSFYQIKRVSVAWGQPYQEFNVWLMLLKSSLFDEIHVPVENPFLYIPGITMLFTSMGVVFAGIAAAVRRLCTKADDWGMKGFWIVLPVTLLGSYVQFCFKYPQTCSGNMRYAAPLALCGAFFLGALWQDEKLRATRAGKILCWVAAALLTVYVLCTVVFYLVVGTLA
ncbi:MAG: glycosyltransferase family 39 protein [Eubacteriales bacterium]|nr:glycosyltransferase family 39 protein [Eubacteriales bacterium]